MSKLLYSLNALKDEFGLVPFVEDLEFGAHRWPRRKLDVQFAVMPSQAVLIKGDNNLRTLDIRQLGRHQVGFI